MWKSCCPKFRIKSLLKINHFDRLAHVTKPLNTSAMSQIHRAMWSTGYSLYISWWLLRISMGNIMLCQASLDSEWSLTKVVKDTSGFQLTLGEKVHKKMFKRQIHQNQNHWNPGPCLQNPHHTGSLLHLSKGGTPALGNLVEQCQNEHHDLKSSCTPGLDLQQLLPLAHMLSSPPNAAENHDGDSVEDTFPYNELLYLKRIWLKNTI